MKRREFWIATLLYAVAWGWMLYFQDPVWDDWILLQRTPAELLAEPDPRMPVYALFALLPLPVFTYHLATFLAMGLVAFSAIRLISKSSFFPPALHFPWLLLLLILPFHAARVACINFPYALSLLLFIIGWHGILQKTSTWQKIAGILAVFLSFMTPSLLVFFYGFWVAYLFGELNATNAERIQTIPSKLKEFLTREGYLLLLPLIAWWLRNQYFKPEGLYQEYYAVQFSGLLQAPLLTLKVLIKTIREGLQELWSSNAGLVGTGLACLTYLTEQKGWIKSFPLRFPLLSLIHTDALRFLGLGLFLWICGVFPYVAIGKEPGFHDWLSRHQLLMSPGFIFLLTGLLILLPHLLSDLLFRSLVFSSLALCFNFGLEWKEDQKQFEAICRQARALSIPEHTGVVILELPPDLRFARNRSIRFYELGGALHLSSPESGILWFTDPPGPVEITEEMKSQRYFLGGSGAAGRDTFVTRVDGALPKNRNFMGNESDR